MTMIYTKNINIHYNVTSSQMETPETIVFAHGAGLSSEIWNWIMPFLKLEFNIVSFDFRGHGETKAQQNEIDWELLFNDFEILLRELNLNEYHFVGHGLGAHFGVEYFSSNQHSAKSFTILSTPCYYPNDLAKKELENRKQLAKESMEAFINKMINNICYPVTVGKKNLLKSLFSSFDIDSYFDILCLCLNSVSLNKLKLVHIPTLVLMGENDPLYPPQLNSLNLSYLPNGLGYIIPKSSNLVHIDQPEKTAKMIASFINELIQGNENAIPKPDIKLNQRLQSMLNSGHELINKSNILEVSIEKGFVAKMNSKEIFGRWNQRKAKDIIVYIAYNEGRTTRENIIQAFWPDKTLSTAKSNLRVSMNHIKRIFENNNLHFEDIFFIDSNYISLKCKIEFSLKNLIELLNKINDEPNIKNKNKLNLELLNINIENLFAGFNEDWCIKLKNDIEDRILQIQQVLLMINKEANNSELAILNLKKIIQLNGNDEETITNFTKKLSNTTQHFV